MMGLPPTRTVLDPPEVVAEQCLLHPRLPQQGCGETDIPDTTTARPFTRTELTPLVASPPAELASPCRCIAGILS